MATELTANSTAPEANKSLITVIIEDHPGQGPSMGSTYPPGPALAAAAADADPVTLLVLGWLAAKRSANTRTAYARDIGITPQRRASRAPSWLAWCQEQGAHPVTGVTGLHVARYARQLDAAALSPASAARKLAAVAGWYAWLAQRGHLAASPAAGIAPPRAGPPTPATPTLTPDQALALVHAADTAPGPQRARTAALVAVLLFTGARVGEVIGADVADLGTDQGRRVLWVTRAKGRRQGLVLPGPAASRIDAYLAGRPGLTGVPVLFATRTGGRLFAADVRRAVRRLATRAGLPADLTSHLGPRVMRHSFAALYLDAGGSLRNLQSAMGYADPRATRRYDRARHTPVIDLARPQQRHRAPPQPHRPHQLQPACQARDPGSGPWPGSRPHCRARRPQHATGHTRPRLFAEVPGDQRHMVVAVVRGDLVDVAVLRPEPARGLLSPHDPQLAGEFTGSRGGRRHRSRAGSRFRTQDREGEPGDKAVPERAGDPVGEPG
jgi:site-specific recombinase XerD